MPVKKKPTALKGTVMPSLRPLRIITADPTKRGKLVMHDTRFYPGGGKVTKRFDLGYLPREVMDAFRQRDPKKYGAIKKMRKGDDKVQKQAEEIADFLDLRGTKGGTRSTRRKRYKKKGR